MRTRLLIFTLSLTVLSIGSRGLYAEGLSVGLGAGMGSHTLGFVGGFGEMQGSNTPLSVKLLVAQYSRSWLFDISGKIGNPGVGFLFPNLGVGLGVHTFSSKTELDLHVPLGCKFRMSEFLGVESEIKYSLILTSPVTHDIGLFIGLYYRLLE